MAPIQFGFLVFDYQPLDVIGPQDLLNSASKEYMQGCSQFGPVKADPIARAPEFVFHHIGLSREPVLLLPSSVITLTPSTTVDECPELDCLLLGGPDPVNFELHPKYAEFIQRHVAAGKLLFTNCTGAAVAAAAGVLDGKNATINNLAFKMVKTKYPNVKWTNDKKWVVDGNIWTGGGAVAGMDMFSYWLRENFGLDVLTQGASFLDYEPRDINGVLDVIPKRYDESGKQLPTHEFPDE
ncbi:hypothetical protein FALBO_14298 [Fusarium albosuccineum]|uniref:DJ-1/PfpI domain-containing protein n=1 Tax=Fusarium albosuccineum TaxID=1237068 RepID=A0A8H4P1C6_9HYPO|nr:hypothetical protein FALBO_14298 [Fusarium albosuccineum]